MTREELEKILDKAIEMISFVPLQRVLRGLVDDIRKGRL